MADLNRLIGGILDRIDMAPNDDPLPYIREYVEHLRDNPVADDRQAETIPDFWRCFHCDFHTNIREEAEAHFGERDDAEEFKPICKWWSNMDEAERRETLQDSIRDLRHLQDESGRAETRIEVLEAALRGLIHDTQEWCDAVDADSSWDGWDHHYKALAYGGLDEYRAALAAPSGETKGNK